MSTSRQPSAIGEIRLAWVLLAVVTAAAFAEPPADLRWTVLLGGMWLIGFGTLFGGSGVRVADAITLVSSRPIFRAAAGMSAALLVLLALILTVSASLTVLLGAGAVVLVLGSLKGAPTVERVVTASAIVGVFVALALGVLEVILRREPFATTLGVPSEQAKWEHRYDRLWEQNVFRFRSPYERVARTPNTARVITLGDSFTWGDKIANSEDVWPAKLEQALAKRLPSEQRIEVINMGHSGWTTAIEAEMLRRLGWQFEPDLVIVQFLVNDALPSRPNFQWDVPHERISLIPSRFTSGYIRHSAVWWTILKGVRTVVEGPAGRDRYRKMYFSHFEPGWTGWLQLQEALREMGQTSRERNTPVMLVLFPLLMPGTWTSESYHYREIHERVAAAADSAGLVVLDLTSTFAAQGGNWLKWWATPYDGHPSPEGHELAAQAIARRIDDLHLLRPVEARSLPRSDSSIPPQKAVP